MKKIIALFMMGLITILSPITLKANTYSIDQPVIDLNNHTLNEVFTTTEKDLTDYEITSLIDSPVYEGLSLRDIFETGNLVDETFASGWSLLNATGSVIDTNYIFTATAQFGGIQYTVDTIGINYYVATKLKTLGTNYRIYFANTAVYLNVAGTGNFELLSKIFNPDVGNTRLRVYDFASISWAEIEVDYVFNIPMSLFSTAPTQSQLDEWLAVYLDPTSFTGYNDIDPFIFYTAPDGTIFNVTEIINDQVYSPLNDDTFDNLSQAQIENQFVAWETLGLTAQTVLSYTEFLTFAPALSVDDMNYWYNYYNLILEYDEVQAGILSDLEITILVIALVLFIIGIALAIYFKHKIMFFVTGLLWFVPIVIVPNIFIVTFSVIMIIIFGLLAFYNSKERDFD